MRVDKIGVHRTHCCIKHGCKYGDRDCPVVLGKVLQEYLCEDCNYFYEEYDNNITYTELGVENDIKMFNEIKKLFLKKNRKYKINKINGD